MRGTRSGTSAYWETERDVSVVATKQREATEGGIHWIKRKGAEARGGHL